MPSTEDLITALRRERTGLWLIVGQPGAGKSHLLRSFEGPLNTRHLNLGRELARALLDSPIADRPRIAQPTLTGLVEKSDSPIALLDNTEFLFESHLRLQPVDVLRNLARIRVVVAAVTGKLSDSHLVFASPEHPNFARIPLAGLPVVEIVGFQPIIHHA
jgi:energy-coupling factor transporter ATP-binding protein EcfA2